MIKKILNEMTATMDLIYELKTQIAKVECDKSELECQLWMSTNWSDLGLSNSDQRKAYVKKELKDKTKMIADLKNELLYAENQLKIQKMKYNIILELGPDVLTE